MDATWLLKKMLNEGSVRLCKRQNRSKQSRTCALAREARYRRSLRSRMTCRANWAQDHGESPLRTASAAVATKERRFTCSSEEKLFSFVIATLKAWNRSKVCGKVSTVRAKLSGT